MMPTWLPAEQQQSPGVIARFMSPNCWKQWNYYACIHDHLKIL